MKKYQKDFILMRNEIHIEMKVVVFCYLILLSTREYNDNNKHRKQTRKMWFGRN